MKALDFLSKNKTISERAESYTNGIKKNIQYSILTSLENARDKIKSEIFDLQDFNLTTDLNKDMRRMSQQDCEARFIKIIELEYELTLMEVEIKSKQLSFDKYFTDAQD